jgi:hypothetical protein
MENEMTKEIEERISQAREDRLRQNASTLWDHLKEAAGGRYALDAGKKTDLKGGYPKGRGIWGDDNVNGLEESLDYSINKP